MAGRPRIKRHQGDFEQNGLRHWQPNVTQFRGDMLISANTGDQSSSSVQ